MDLIVENMINKGIKPILTTFGLVFINILCQHGLVKINKKHTSKQELETFFVQSIDIKPNYLYKFCKVWYQDTTEEKDRWCYCKIIEYNDTTEEYTLEYKDKSTELYNVDEYLTDGWLEWVTESEYLESKTENNSSQVKSINRNCKEIQAGFHKWCTYVCKLQNISTFRKSCESRLFAKYFNHLQDYKCIKKTKSQISKFVKFKPLYKLFITLKSYTPPINTKSICERLSIANKTAWNEFGTFKISNKVPEVPEVPMNHIAKFHNCACIINTGYQQNKYVDSKDASNLKQNILQYIQTNNVMPGDIMFVGSKVSGYPEHGFVIIDENMNPIFDEFGYNLLYKIESLIKTYQINYLEAFNQISTSDCNQIFFIEGVSEQDSVVEEYKNAGLWFVINTDDYYKSIKKCQVGTGPQNFVKISKSIIGTKFKIWINKKNSESWDELWVRGKIISFNNDLYEHYVKLEDGRKIHINIIKKIEDEYATGMKWFDFIKFD